MSAQMTADNPYSAPGAELSGGQSELYTPSIFSFNGRIGRLRYLAYNMGSYIVMTIAMIPLVGAAAFMGGETAMSGIGVAIIAVMSVAMMVMAVMFGKRRFNDLNRSGWWLLLLIVPLVGFLISIYLVFFPGTDGDNNFGPAQTANTLGVQILAWMMPVMFVVGIIAAVALPQILGLPAQ